MFLLQMAGYPGSGKSTLAIKIADKLSSVVVIDRDIIKSAMMDEGVRDSVINKASYKVMFDLANQYLRQGMSVIIDTPCYYEESLISGINIAKNNGATYKYIECRVENYKVIEHRIYNREKYISQIDTTSLDRYNKSSNKSIRPSKYNYMIVDTTSYNSYSLDDIIKYLVNKGGKI
ncbi:ATP-binding protein [Clostridiaceae bacterium M8S5]|nr:ATP-binding protein [Clostridiaceae bacterium M8S5]